jgi:hypothetical protein
VSSIISPLLLYKRVRSREDSGILVILSSAVSGVGNMTLKMVISSAMPSLQCCDSVPGGGENVQELELRSQAG